nr:beta-D-glucosyl crocetin beta-1,6-glucosyltransferase-like [Tanacetum cinerariifolium]
MCNGILIIAMPMQYDQPYNARLVEAIGVGDDLGRDADGRLKREEMAILVRNMVVGGGHMREKVKDLGVLTLSFPSHIDHRKYKEEDR